MQISKQILQSVQYDHYLHVYNILSNDKILDVTKLKAFADDKLYAAKITISLFDREENMSKRENAGNQHFLLFS